MHFNTRQHPHTHSHSPSNPCTPHTPLQVCTRPCNDQAITEIAELADTDFISGVSLSLPYIYPSDLKGDKVTLDIIHTLYITLDEMMFMNKQSSPVCVTVTVTV